MLCSRLRAEDTEKHLMTDRESFRLIARRGTICWETMTHLHQLNPVYETSFHQFLTIFRIATSHSDRSVNVSLTVCLLLCIFLWLSGSVCLFVFPSLYLSVDLFLCLSQYFSIFALLSECFINCLGLRLFLYAYVDVSVSFCLRLCLLVFQFVCLSLCLLLF